MDNYKIIISQIETFYSIISGLSTDNRDWLKLKVIFHENAILTPHKLTDNEHSTKPFAVDEYVERLDGFLRKNDFFEFSVKNHVSIFGNVCSVYNEYAAYRDGKKTNFIKKGVNLIQLLFDGNYWKIVSMLWEDQ